jgi:hypothetical protein
MTMTDEEKAQARATDPLAAALIDRCDSMSPEAMQQLHGILRNPHAGSPRGFDELDEQGWELWAIYHSHTHSEAYPSDTDRRLAFYPDSRYLVLSLADRDRPELRSFFILDGEIEEEELTIA